MQQLTLLWKAVWLLFWPLKKTESSFKWHKTYSTYHIHLNSSVFHCFEKYVCLPSFIITVMRCIREIILSTFVCQTRKQDTGGLWKPQFWSELYLLVHWQVMDLKAEELPLSGPLTCNVIKEGMIVWCVSSHVCACTIWTSVCVVHSRVCVAWKGRVW